MGAHANFNLSLDIGSNKSFPFYVNCKETIIYIKYDTRKMKHTVYSGSYMIAHVLLNLLNELEKRDKK